LRHPGEISETDAYTLINNNIKLVCEGANAPCSEAIDILSENPLAPGKAANASGVAVAAGLVNSMRLSWLGEEVDERLRIIMKAIHQTCLEPPRIRDSGNYLNGASSPPSSVVNAMLTRGGWRHFH
jgi:glutamate dehydrogenase (NADP+)